MAKAFDELERLGFRRPRQGGSLAEVAHSWHAALRDLPAWCVAEAFSRYAREKSRWPTLAAIRRLAEAVQREQPAAVGSLREAYLTWERRGWRDEGGAIAPCPVCHRLPSLSCHRPASVPHDRRRHAELRIPALR